MIGELISRHPMKYGLALFFRLVYLKISYFGRHFMDYDCNFDVKVIYIK